MFHHYPIHLQAMRLQAQWSGEGNRDIRAVSVAWRLYQRSHRAGCLRRLWSTLTRRARCLLDLRQVEENCTIRGRYYAGIQTVSLARIRGSTGRCRDFDDQFHPLKVHNKNRWLNIAAAQQMRANLPPVVLVRVGDVYFVQDGHHRVSVARAMGQKEIEAEVTVWQAVGPLPWERPLQPQAATTWHPRPA